MFGEGVTAQLGLGAGLAAAVARMFRLKARWGDAVTLNQASNTPANTSVKLNNARGVKIPLSQNAFSRLIGWSR
jgi:hypothetical protein